jgi:hypothetical protein
MAGAAEQFKVPRMTLTDRLKKYSDPTKAPKVGRPQELSAEVEAVSHEEARFTEACPVIYAGE